ncbi:NUDIX hydrolase [Congregibacter litoralis]|uniref:NUDIX hydrolase n=1 Tax=Congregibacter litoralis TaxID=393662 RepID=UPI0003247265|nr:NUDIX hydrolase [Congregibacter litoralis]
MNVEFSGSKLALLFGSKVLVYKRDNFEHIPFPGCWDFPGGGREGQESPEECVLRELYEEFALSIPATRLAYRRRVTSTSGIGSSYFFVAKGFHFEIDAIVFGAEGQYWDLMQIEDFLAHPQAVPALVSRLRSYLEAVCS